MSLILEALRKSEAERQRGRAPGLFVAQSPAVAPARAAPAWAWVLGAMLAAVLLAWAWREWHAQPATQASAGPDEAAASTAAPPPAPAAVPMPTLPAPLPLVVAPAPRPVPSPSPGPSPSLAAAPAPAPVAAPPAAAVEPEPAAEPSPPAPATTVAAADPPEPALPTLAQLPADDRARLPALKVSMHVYADDPAQRFVILDGQRLTEGASPAAGVVVERIRRDGVVLAVDGQRLLLARP